MTGRYRVLPSADRDLDDQAGYLAEHAGLQTALRFYANAASSFATIAGMPGIGEPWRSTDPCLAGTRVGRIKGFERHLIFYRPTDDGVDIIRVLHGTRDLPIALDSDPAD
jgi:toxin ParE1/3/4